ncbi:MAG: hypothetical protein RMX65_009755 [Nostoc sp. DedQUE01]
MKSDAPTSLTDRRFPALRRQLLSDARRQERTGSTFRCALCGSLRQAAPRLRSLYSLAHLHTELV